jgi:hypothetical protein
MDIRRYRSSDRRAVWELHNVALRQIRAHPGNGQWDRDLIARTTIGQMAARRLYSGFGYREIGRSREGTFEVLTFEKRLAR